MLAERELPPPQLGDALLRVEQQLGRKIAERHDDRGIDEAELGLEIRAAGVDLDGERVAVAGWAALHHVGDVDRPAVEADLLDETGEELAGAADERLALEVLL